MKFHVQYYDKTNDPWSDKPEWQGNADLKLHGSYLEGLGELIENATFGIGEKEITAHGYMKKDNAYHAVMLILTLPRRKNT